MKINYQIERNNLDTQEESVRIAELKVLVRASSAAIDRIYKVVSESIQAEGGE